MLFPETAPRIFIDSNARQNQKCLEYFEPLLMSLLVQAIKAMAKMLRDTQAHLRSELEAIARSPLTYSGDFTQLKGGEGWRLRLGKYRVLCHIDSGELLILVVDAGPRGDISK